jgi:hypothetical protein
MYIHKSTIYNVLQQWETILSEKACVACIAQEPG